MISLPDIGKPAANALEPLGVTNLEQLAKVDKRNLSRVHGIGPKAIDILEKQLASQNLAFKKYEPLPFNPNFGVFGSLGCDNAPKREILRDFVISFVQGHKKGLAMTCNDDVGFQGTRDHELIGMEEVYQYSKKRNYQASSLDLKTIITHGKEGAVYSSLVTTKGKKIELVWFVNFKSHKKDALIQDISFFEI